MSQSESNPSLTLEANDTSEINVAQGTCHGKQHVDFTDHGQAIGPNAGKYATHVGKVLRTHCPPTYPEWPAIPDQTKDDIWLGISGTYDVPEKFKEEQLQKANKIWKNWKSDLRKHLDKYSTNQERKRNRASGVKKEDWELFVDLESTEEARIRREKGKTSRKQLKNAHTTGRRGAARTAELLVTNDPTNPGTRTDFYLATHTRRDGSFLSEEISEKMNKLNEIIANDPSSKHQDLDHDPVAQVFGLDGRGQVRGMGGGVSKTTLMAAAPYKKKAEEECRSRMELQDQLGDLKRQVTEEKGERRKMQEQLDALTARQGTGCGSQIRLSTNSTTSPEVPMHTITRQSTIPHSGSSQQICELLSLGGRVAAFGTILVDREGVPENAYKIVVDDIYDRSVELFGASGKTFDDIEVGHAVHWLKALTRLV